MRLPNLVGIGGKNVRQNGYRADCYSATLRSYVKDTPGSEGTPGREGKIQYMLVTEIQRVNCQHRSGSPMRLELVLHPSM